ncbi:MAG: permease-like cell division protein FtsX [Candidatus Eremiobacteraeota bacterium]|nr:permease-like cell division protein FtsX [Candidatus Eremiobacteraeota bacterium]
MNPLYFFREVFTNLRRNALMNLASISTVTVSAIVLGLFLISTLNLGAWVQNIVDQLKIVVYLKNEVTPEQIDRLYKAIKANPEVETVEFISKQSALKRLQAKLKISIRMNNLPENPLPNAFEITLKDSRKISEVAGELETFPGTERVKFGQNIAQKLLSLHHAVRVGGLLLVTLSMLCTILIIMNTIRLTVYARRREIRIMQLVGAAFWFIRWPFILEGVLQGLLGALPAFILVYFSYQFFVPRALQALPFIPFLPAASVMHYLLWTLLLTGIIVGGMGALLSVNKYLSYE